MGDAGETCTNETLMLLMEWLSTTNNIVAVVTADLSELSIPTAEGVGMNQEWFVSCACMRIAYA